MRRLIWLLGISCVVLLGAAGDITHNNVTANGEISAGGVPVDRVQYHRSVTGVITGGEVTINVDNTKFDVAAGTGVIVDWTDPANPISTEVSFGPFTAEDALNIGSTPATQIAIDANGDIFKSNAPLTATQRRAMMELQFVGHGGGVLVGLGGGASSAYEIHSSIIDVLKAIGNINFGNSFSANGTNLLLDKSTGTTTGIWINKSADAQNPCIQTNAAESPVSSMFSSYRDGAGGFTQAPLAAIDPEQWDDGSGTLAAVVANKWTIQRLHWTSNQVAAVSYGQTVYNTLAEALDGVTSDIPVINPLAKLVSSHTGWLVVKQGTADLSDGGLAVFINTDKV